MTQEQMIRNAPISATKVYKTFHKSKNKSTKSMFLHKIITSNILLPTIHIHSMWQRNGQKVGNMSIKKRNFVDKYQNKWNHSKNYTA